MAKYRFWWHLPVLEPFKKYLKSIILGTFLRIANKRRNSMFAIATETPLKYRYSAFVWFFKHMYYWLISFGFIITSSGGIGDKLRADKSFCSSSETIKSKGVLLFKFSRTTLLTWQLIKLTSFSVSLLNEVPLGRIRLIRRWLFSTWGFCHEACGSQKKHVIVPNH